MILLFTVALNTALAAAGTAGEISISYEYKTSPLPLTNERAWKLSPTDPKPFSMLYYLDREVTLDGLKAIQSEENKKFKVEFTGLLAKSEGWIRAFESKPQCHTEAQSNLDRESKAWQTALESGRDSLRIELRSVWADSADQAIAESKVKFSRWLKKVEPQTKLASLEHCLDATPFEQPSKVQNTKLVARLPAKFWGGLYTVHMNAQFGQHTLNGRFLIDSGADRSLVSPAWMASQGVNPKLVEIIGSKILNWSGGQAKSKQAIPFGVSFGGVDTPDVVFHMTDTLLFEPPTFLGSCCDGVIGRDLLKFYAVEFRPGANPEVLFWDRSQMSWGQAVAWTPISDGRLTDCKVDDGKTKGSKIPVIIDTGSDQSIEAPASVVRGRQAKLVCPGWSSQSWEVMDSVAARKRGAISIGMGVLIQGAFTLDLSNGRIWWSKELQAARERLNQTGIDLYYRWSRTEAGERDLVVRKAGKKSGLKPGMVVHRIDGLDVSKLDGVQVERRLMGYHGDSVILGLDGGKAVEVNTSAP